MKTTCQDRLGTDATNIDERSVPLQVEQATFSVIITHCTSCYIPAVGFTLVLSGLCAYAMTAWALPRSGLK